MAKQKGHSGSTSTQEIARRIRELRESGETRLTQAQLAEKMELSIRHMANIESGKRGLTIQNAIKLSEIFGVTVEYICTGHEKPNSMHPTVRLVAEVLNNVQDQRQRERYINAIKELSDIMLNL